MNQLQIKNDVQVTYHYVNKHTGDKLQRTFWVIKDIKVGNDDGHLKLIPNFEFVGISIPDGVR